MVAESDDYWRKMGFRSVRKNCYRLFVGLLLHIFNFHWLIMKPQNPWWVLFILVKGVKYSFGRFHILLCFVTKVCIIIATWRKKLKFSVENTSVCMGLFNQYNWGKKKPWKSADFLTFTISISHLNLTGFQCRIVFIAILNFMGKFLAITNMTGIFMIRKNFILNEPKPSSL